MDIKVLQHSLRKRVARDVARDLGYAYDDVLSIMEDNDMFGNRDRYEIEYMPVDVEEIADFVAECIEPDVYIYPLQFIERR